MSEDVYRLDPQIECDGVKIDMRDKGRGDPPILFLQGLESWIRDETFSDALAENHRVLVPQLPGFGQSEFPAEFRTVDDIAYFFLTLLDELDLRDVVLVGTSFGGWVAAEMAVRSSRRISSLVLANSLGIRVSSDPAVRDVADIYAMSQAEVADHFYHDPEANRRDVTQLPDHVLIGIARSRETMCYLGWQPYMHNPSLKRWLRRIDVPTLVLWGESDEVVSTDYGRAFAGEIPGARFETITGAGHYPHIETPGEFTTAINRFLAGTRQDLKASA